MAEDKFNLGDVSIGVQNAINELLKVKETSKGVKNDIEKGAEFTVTTDDSALDKTAKKVESVESNIDKTKSNSSKKRRKEIREEASEEIRQRKRVTDNYLGTEKVIKTSKKKKDGSFERKKEYTYDNGSTHTFVDDELKSRRKEVVNLKKAYGSLNKDVTEYYQLKTKIDKGKVKPEDTSKTNNRIKELESSILKGRNYIKTAEESGYTNQRLEEKATRVYQSAREDYYNGIEVRKQQEEQKAENQRLSQLKATHDKQQAENEKWIAELNKSYEQEQKASIKNQDKLMAEENKKYVQQQKQHTQEVNNLKKIKQQAKEAVSDESIVTSNANRKSRLDKYSGQSSNDLTNAEYWSSEIESSQLKLKELISSGASLRQLEAEFNNLTTATKAFEASMSAVEATMEKSMTLSSLDTAKDKIENFKKEFSSFMTNSQIGKLDDYKAQYVDGLTGSGASQINKNVAALMNQVKERKKAMLELQSIQKEANDGSFEARETTIKATLSRYDGQDSKLLTKLRTQAEEVKKYQKEIQQALSADDIDTNKVSTAYQNLEMATTRYGNALKEVKQMESRTLSTDEISTSVNSVQTYMKNNTKALKEYESQLVSIENEYRNMTTLGQKLDIDKKFTAVKKEISARGLSGSSPFDDIKRAFKQISQFAGIYGIAQNLMMDTPRAIVNAVKEVNAAQIELAKVSNASGSQLSSYWDEAANSAKKYGATISDVISSTADWSRLGYNLEDSKLLSDVTTLYQKVGDNMTQETASQSLVSTLQGFNLQASQAESIIDKFNEVSNNFAIGSDGIGEALQRSAASFNASHTSLSKSIALITGTNTTLQDPQRVGCKILPTSTVM